MFENNKTPLMSSTSETGHAKNIAHFASLISFCKGYKEKYNPSKTALQTANLDAQHNAAAASLDDVRNTKEIFDKATDTRKDLFKPLKKLATRVVNAFDATDAPESAVENAKSVNRKIQGSRAGDKTEAKTTTVEATITTTTGNTISVSQQSYDQQVEHFASLIQIVSSEPTYAPNETDLTVASLNNLLAEMKKANQQVIDANTGVQNSRLNRNNLLYKDPTGLVPTALDVKKYVKSVFGSDAPEFKQVSGIEFTTPKGF